MNWQSRKLVDIAKPRQWKNLPSSEMTEDGYLVYGANGVIGKYREYTHATPTIAITCRGATCGNLHITEPYSYINSNAMALDDLSNDVNISFLYYALRKRGLKDVISGSAQPQITRENLAKVTIPLPPLEDQVRIATVLTRAEQLIAKRKESIMALDALLKSTFLEMFGDPVRNEKGWEKTNLEDLAIEFKYGTNTISDSKELKGKMPILRIPNIVGERINYADLKYSKIENEEKEKIRLQKGDLLFVRTNGNPAYIGRCAVFLDEIECGYASYLIRTRLRPDSPVSPEFIRAVISFPTYRSIVISKAKTTAGNYNINTESLKSLQIYLPPLSLQNKFAAIDKKIEALKAKYQQSLTELENLYGSLSLRAFKGELDLSGVRV